MALTREDQETIKAIVSAMLRQQPPPPIGEDAIVIDGSYDPSDGTVTAKYGDTDTMFPDTGDAVAMPTRVPLATMQLGDQYGARGNERAVLMAAQSGPIALLIHGPDDSPGAPAGERWIAHRDANGQVDAFIRHTNDGPTIGDGLGGAQYGGTAALSQLTTKAGRRVVENDTAKTLTIASAGTTPHTTVYDDNLGTQGVKTTTINGLLAHLDDVLNQIRHQAGPNLFSIVDAAANRILHQGSLSVYTIVDAAGNAISHVAPNVGIGDLITNLGASNAAFRKIDADTLATSIKKMVGNALQQAAQAAIAASVTNAGPWLAAIQAGLPTLSFADLTSSIASLVAPAGSGGVRIK